MDSSPVSPWSAIERGRPDEVADLQVTDAMGRFQRGVARVLVGREAEGRADLEAAAAEVGAPCRIELALLAIRSRSRVEHHVAEVRQLLPTLVDPAQRARALHVLGVGENHLRRTPAAVDALVEALRLYRAQKNVYRRAMVHDTLGQVHASRGRLDLATGEYALSLVDKWVVGDRPGIALTLGNLGRVHLRAGRFEEAVECFERDLAIVFELGDARAQCRLHGDLGRTHLARGEVGEALGALRHAVRLALDQGLRDHEVFARKDLALACAAAGDLEAGWDELRMAARLLEAPAGFQRALLDAAEGRLLLAGDDPGAAVTKLEAAVRAFEGLDLPDEEVSARLDLAAALVATDLPCAAEAALLRAQRIARSEGQARHLPALNQAMARLELVPRAVEEHRPLAQSDGARLDTDGAYILRGRLGGGGFGDVYRAWDPQRGQEVAIKRLRLGTLYDTRRRRSVLTSARLELEAASRVVHPGVARVLALGMEPDGSVYVVQELVRGRPLRALLPSGPTAPPLEVLRGVALVGSALEALHAAKVVHRDLKPENIIVRDDANLPVLIDFGIAHVAGIRSGFGDAGFLGTLDYMAPEQASGERIDERADLHALGVIAFEWLTGVRPLRLRGEDLAARILDLRERQAPPLSDFRPGLPDALVRLVASLLEKRPGRRPASALRLVDECRAIARRLAPDQPVEF